MHTAIPIPGGEPDEMPLHLHENRSAADGPTVLVLGGVHGDEPGGMRAAQRVIHDLDQLKSGRLQVVPVCNPEAAQARTRVSPSDGLNLARVFPGDAGGSRTERIAAALTPLIRRVDLLIDLHTASDNNDMPLMAGCVNDGGPAGQQSLDLARRCGLPFVWQHPRSAGGRTLSVAHDHGIPALYFESEGGNRFRQDNVDRYVLATRRCLVALGLWDDSYPDLDVTGQVEVHGDGDLDSGSMRAPHDGFFEPQHRAGDSVDSADVIGQILDTAGRCAHNALSPRQGRIMLLHSPSWVHRNDKVALVCEEVVDGRTSAA